MRIKALDILMTTFVVFFFSPAIFAAEDVKVSPHSEEGDCAICHVAPANKLRGWFVSGSTKRALKEDPNQLCLKCHTIEPNHAGGFLGIGIGHATGKKTAVNHKNLPLASDGTITCATTCHNVHATPDDRQLYVKRLRLPVNVLCTSCHNM